MLIDKRGIIVNINKNETICNGLKIIELLNQHYSQFPFICKIIDNYIGYANFDSIYEKYNPKTTYKNTIDLENKFFEVNYAIVNLEGHPHVQLLIYDITENILIEKKTIKQDKLLTKVAHISNLSVWEYSFTENNILLSVEAIEMLGAKKGEHVVSVDFILSKIHTEDLPYVLDVFSKINLKFDNKQIAYRIIREDKSIRYILSNLQQEYDTTTGEPTKLIGISIDTTETKLKEIEIQSVTEINRRIIDASEEIFYIAKVTDLATLSSGLTYISKKYINIFGNVNEDFFTDRSNLIQAIHSEDRDYVKQCSKEIYETKKPITRQFRLYNATTQKYCWILDIVKPVLNDKGDIYEFYGFYKDITEFKNIELSLVKASEDLIDRYSKIQHYNQVLSHNIRGPVDSLLGLAEVMTLQDFTVDDKNQIFNEILGVAKNLNNVILDLTLAMETVTAIDVEYAELELDKIVSNVFVSLKREIEATKAVVNIDIQENANTITSIKKYLYNILRNIIENSIKFRSPNRPPQISITCKKEENSLVILIADNGTGIDLHKYSNKIFGLYNRFNVRVEGKGLGLYISKLLLEKLGGKITVESELDKGAIFCIRF